SVERSRNSIKAAQIFAENAYEIAKACAVAVTDEIVVASVGREMGFGGVSVIPLSQLREFVADLGWGGWALVSAPGSSITEIESRCRQMAGNAEARLLLTQNILRKSD